MIQVFFFTWMEMPTGIKHAGGFEEGIKTQMRKLPDSWNWNSSIYAEWWSFQSPKAICNIA